MVMGKHFEIIAKYLQLKQSEIDMIKVANPFPETMVHKILLKWKSKLGSSATLEVLEKSFHDAERDTGVSVDWDDFERAKQSILAHRK
jgi:hypothetical protein